MSGRQPLSLKARAVALLAQRDHSASELRAKLLRLARSRAEEAARAGEAHEDADEEEGTVDIVALAEEVDTLLDWLRTQGYLDESRFVESRLHARTARWGQRRIEQELSQHGLSLDADQRAQLAATELERARELLRRKFSDLPSADPAQQARQLRFLLGRGFGAELARRAMRLPSDD